VTLRIQIIIIKERNLKYKDPHKQREKEKYGRPIPSRELILEVLTNAPSPMAFKPLANELGLSEDVDRDALKYRLRAMERDGQLLFNRRRQYIPVSSADLIAGRVIGHADGFGFLVPDDGGDDLFLSGKQMRQLLHGDRALASVAGIDRKGRREGVVIEVLERNTSKIVGRFFQERGIGFVVPDNKRLSQDIIIPAEHFNGADDSQIVMVSIIEQPTRRSRPIGKITEILGEHMGPGMEIDIALRSHDLPYEWPAAVDKECLQYNSENISKNAKKGRVDLRKTPLVTIDGEDSRDFDDAVYCERDGKNWRLLVAIADVSHYVRPGAALDQEAWNRGTSVYFPEQVIPMLPEVLSNGLCSLNPDVDRLCMVCDARISPQGKIISYHFFDAVMHSAARLTYNEMASLVVDKDPEARKKRRGILKHLDNLYCLYKVLRKEREKRGAIDFETSETRIIFGDDKKIEKIIPAERNEAHKLIEECMILANVCAAKFLQKHNIPNLNRCHPAPQASKLEDLHSFLGGLGLTLGGGDEPGPKDYSKLLKSIKGRLDAHLIQTVLLRSLSQATYSPDLVGHFGLALESYAHFTSPIRRYPDLLVHRGIRHVIQGKKAKQFKYSHADMVALGEHCSMTERRAEDAGRDVTAWLKAEYMQDKVGETFEGVITAVTGFGLFVELNEIHVEGLIHVTALTSDYYHFDPMHHRLTGEHSGKRFRLGDPITVIVARVDLDERKIDFILPGSDKDKGRGNGKANRRKSRNRSNEPSKGQSKGKQKGRSKEKPGQKRNNKKSNRKSDRSRGRSKKRSKKK
jgi:ribonuclease R